MSQHLLAMTENGMTVAKLLYLLSLGFFILQRKYFYHQVVVKIRDEALKCPVWHLSHRKSSVGDKSHECKPRPRAGGRAPHLEKEPSQPPVRCQPRPVRHMELWGHSRKGQQRVSRCPR